jgi:hypothetical protein
MAAAINVTAGHQHRGTAPAIRGLLPADATKETTMGDLLKGGLLWLLGVPLILVIILFATGIL